MAFKYSRVFKQSFICIIFICFIDGLTSLSSYLIQPYWCDSISLGEIGIDIMNWPTILDEENNVVVTRGEKTLSEGDTYVIGEMLTVTLSNPDIVGSRAHQFIFETTVPAMFQGTKTGCGGRRSINNTTQLTMPSDSESGSLQPIYIFAAWSKGYGQVKITSNFTLNPPPATVDTPNSDTEL